MADAALSEQRAHGAVPDQDARPEQLSQIRTQGKDLAPFWSHIRAEERGCVYSFTSSAGVSSAGVGTCHGACASPGSLAAHLAATRSFAGREICALRENISYRWASMRSRIAAYNSRATITGKRLPFGM